MLSQSDQSNVIDNAELAHSPQNNVFSNPENNNDVPNSEIIVIDGQLTTLMAMKKLTGISVPIMVSFTFSFSMIAIAIFSGHSNSDDDHVAATTLITVTTNAIAAIPLTPLTAIGILQSKAFGDWKLLNSELASDQQNVNLQISYQDKTPEMSNYNKNGIVVSMLAAALPTLSLIYTKPILVDVLGQDEHIADIATDYLKIYSIAIPALAWRVGAEQPLFSCRQEKAAALIGVVNFSLALGVSYVVCFGAGNVPSMGLKGVAFGFIAEAYLTAAAYSLYIAFQKDLQPFKFFRRCNFHQQDLKQIKEILKIGLPMFLTVANELGAQVAINSLIGRYGERELAAQDYLSQFTFIMYVPRIALGLAASQEFGRAFGAKQYQDASCYAKSGIWTAIALILPFVIAVSIYPEMLEFLITKSNNNLDIEHLLRTVAPISTVGVLLDAMSFVLLQDLRVVNDNTAPAILSVSNMWASVLLGYLLGFKFDLGLTGIATGYTAGLFSRAAMLFCRWRKRTTPEALQKTSQQAQQPRSEKSTLQAFKDKCSSVFFCCGNRHTDTQQELLNDEVSNQHHQTYNSQDLIINNNTMHQDTFLTCS